MKKLYKDKNLVTVLLIYVVSILIEWFVVFNSVYSYPGLYDPKSSTWSGYPPWLSPTRFYFFGLERTIILMLHPISIIVAWFAWEFLGCMSVSYVLIPHHKGSILAKFAPFFKERSNQRYLITRESPHKKNFGSIVKASILPFTLLLSVSILMVKDVLLAFPPFYVAKPFSMIVMILMPCTIFVNFALYVMQPLLAFIIPSIWILEGSGLRYYDLDKKTMVEVVSGYKGAIHGLSGLAAAISFLSLLYEIMITHSLGLDYIVGYLSFTIFFLYPSTLLVTALYVHFSEVQSLKKVLGKMKNSGFPLHEVPSIEVD